MNNELTTNRRIEHRFHVGFGRRLGWCAQGRPTKHRKGWLNDVSTSGLSFLVQSGQSPDVGQDVDVCDHTPGTRTVFHVVRMQHLDDNLTLVGCRKATANGVAQLPPSPRTLQYAGTNGTQGQARSRQMSVG